MVDTLHDVLARTETLSFDCYGTLIDWESGLKAWFVELFGEASAERAVELFETYLEAEAAIQGAGYQPYRDVIAGALERVAQQFNGGSAPAPAADVPRIVAGWQPFPDTNDALLRLKKRFRLELSNAELELEAITAEWQLKSAHAELAALEVNLRNELPALQASLARVEASYHEAVLRRDVDQELFDDGLTLQRKVVLTRSDIRCSKHYECRPQPRATAPTPRYILGTILQIVTACESWTYAQGRRQLCAVVLSAMRSRAVIRNWRSILLSLPSIALRNLFRDPAELTTEDLGLRRQLAVLHRTAKRPKLRKRDRLLWTWLARCWVNWRSVLLIVQPETVIHRFREPCGVAPRGLEARTDVQREAGRPCPTRS